MDKRAAGPTDVACSGGRVTGGAVLSARRYMVGELGGAVGTLVALRSERTVVASIAACPTHRRMVHRVSGEGRRRVGVTRTALRCARRNMRRRHLPGCDYVVMTSNAVGIGWPMRIGRVGERDRAGVTGFARQGRGNMVAGLA